MIRKILIAALLMFSATAGAWAQHKTKSDTQKVQITESEIAFSLANELVNYGYANNSALSLIEAAKIIKENGLKEGTIPGNNPQKLDSDKATESNQTLDVVKLIADAKKLAAGDKNLVALADKVAATNTRSESVNAPYSSEYVYVAYNGEKKYTWNLSHGQIAKFYITGSSSDLDLTVEDEAGNEVPIDENYSHNPSVVWQANGNQRYTIWIDNNGDKGTGCYVHSYIVR